MFNAISDIVSHPLPDTPTGERPRRRFAAPRTGEPVRRHSRLAGREGTFWRPMSREDARRIVFAARRFDRSTKKKGQRNGALGHVALEIIDLLANLMNRRTGQLDPSLDFLMRTLGRSRDAIVRALAALRRHGFLDWLRRYVPTGNDTGPQVQQTSNAYRLLMPPALGRIIRLYFTKAPTPDDEAARIDDLAAQIEAYKRQLSLRELPLFYFAKDCPLGKALARLGGHIEDRESAGQTESLIQ